MPTPKDITNDLSRLHRKPLPRAPIKAQEPAFPGMRKMAFDPILWLTLALLAGTLISQLILPFWRW
jgi:hypothetical protein